MADHLLATFTRRSGATAASRQIQAVNPGVRVRVGDREDAFDALALEQRDELSESVPIISTGIVTGPFARGALVWGGIGLIVGAVVAVPFALLFDAGISTWWLALYFAAAGGLGLASAAFILGAGHQAEVEGAGRPEDPTAVVRVDGSEEDLDDLRGVLVAAGARSVHEVDHVDRRPSADAELPTSHGTTVHETDPR